MPNRAESRRIAKAFKKKKGKDLTADYMRGYRDAMLTKTKTCPDHVSEIAVLENERDFYKIFYRQLCEWAEIHTTDYVTDWDS